MQPTDALDSSSRAVYGARGCVVALLLKSVDVAREVLLVWLDARLLQEEPNDESSS